MSAPTNAQLSPYSSLAHAMEPTAKPIYELPQDVYHADARIASSAGIEPIFFQLNRIHNGTSYMNLSMLLGDLSILTNIMARSADRVFEDRQGTVRLDLKIMWPGYTARTMQMTVNSENTTRALLARAIGEKIHLFMNNVFWTQSSLDKYRIGPDGIQVRQVLLRGIKHITGDRWKAIIFIDNSMNVQT